MTGRGGARGPLQQPSSHPPGGIGRWGPLPGRLGNGSGVGPSGQRTSPLGVPGEEENGRYWLREQLTDGAFGCDGGETIHPFVSVSESECEQV